MTAKLNGKTETESFPLTIDNQAPEVLKSEVVYRKRQAPVEGNGNG